MKHEEQYSIWPARGGAAGRKDARKTGSEEECLAHIEAGWTDLLR